MNGYDPEVGLSDMLGTPRSADDVKRYVQAAPSGGYRRSLVEPALYRMFGYHDPESDDHLEQSMMAVLPAGRVSRYVTSGLKFTRPGAQQLFNRVYTPRMQEALGRRLARMKVQERLRVLNEVEAKLLEGRDGLRERKFVPRWTARMDQQRARIQEIRAREVSSPRTAGNVKTGKEIRAAKAAADAEAARLRQPARLAFEDARPVAREQVGHVAAPQVSETGASLRHKAQEPVRQAFAARLLAQGVLSSPSESPVVGLIAPFLKAHPWWGTAATLATGLGAASAVVSGDREATEKADAAAAARNTADRTARVRMRLSDLIGLSRDPERIRREVYRSEQSLYDYAARAQEAILTMRELEQDSSDQRTDSDVALYRQLMSAAREAAPEAFDYYIGRNPDASPDVAVSAFVRQGKRLADESAVRRAAAQQEGR